MRYSSHWGCQYSIVPNQRWMVKDSSDYLLCYHTKKIDSERRRDEPPVPLREGSEAKMRNTKNNLPVASTRSPLCRIITLIWLRTVRESFGISIRLSTSPFRNDSKNSPRRISAPIQFRLQGKKKRLKNWSGEARQPKIILITHKTTTEKKKS